MGLHAHLHGVCISFKAGIKLLALRIVPRAESPPKDLLNVWLLGAGLGGDPPGKALDMVILRHSICSAL